MGQLLNSHRKRNENLDIFLVFLICHLVSSPQKRYLLLRTKFPNRFMSFSMTPDVPQNLNALLLFEFNWHILPINVRSKPVGFYESHRTITSSMGQCSAAPLLWQQAQLTLHSSIISFVIQQQQRQQRQYHNHARNCSRTAPSVKPLDIRRGCRKRAAACRSRCCASSHLRLRWSAQFEPAAPIHRP